MKLQVVGTRMSDEWEQRILNWLSEEGITNERKPTPELDFHYVITFPPGDKYTVGIIKRKDKKDSICLQSGIRLSDQEQAQIRKLNEEKRKNLFYELLFLLGTLKPYPRLDFSSDGFLQGFVFDYPIYFDELTKHRLFSSMAEMHRAKMMGLWKVQQLLGTMFVGPEPESAIGSDITYA